MANPLPGAGSSARPIRTPSCPTPSARWTPSMSSRRVPLCTPRRLARPARAADAGVPAKGGPESNMPQEQGHKWFAAIYDRMMASAERSFMKHVRSEIAGEATGRVLEVGAGTGANFAYYQDGAEVVATEPDPFMLQRARERLQAAGRPIELKQAPADQLPFEDASFDTGISTLVMCSVSDPMRALYEMRRGVEAPGQVGSS